MFHSPPRDRFAPCICPWDHCSLLRQFINCVLIQVQNAEPGQSGLEIPNFFLFRRRYRLERSLMSSVPTAQGYARVDQGVFFCITTIEISKCPCELIDYCWRRIQDLLVINLSVHLVRTCMIFQLTQALADLLRLESGLPLVPKDVLQRGHLQPGGLAVVELLYLPAP